MATVKASATVTLTAVTDVAGVWRYYLAKSATASAPTKPADNVRPPADTSWKTTEPAYTAGYALYLTDCTVFSDGTCAYSPVSLSSSYTAAQGAYNKASAAESTAGTASDSVMYEVPYYCVKASGETPTQPTVEYPADWSTTVSTDSFTDGGTVYKCVKKVYPNRTSDAFSWEAYTVDKVATQALQNKENARLQGQYFWHDTSGAHVVERLEDGSYPARVDIASDGMTVHRTVDGSTHDIAHFGYNAATKSAESRVGELNAARTITDTSGIHFYGNNNPSVSIADIDSSKSRLEIKQADVSDYMQFASFAWFARGKHMSLKVVE